MSFLISPFLDVGIRMTLSAAGNILYYTGRGVWWLGRRAIYGRESTLSPEEEAHAERVRLIQQNEDLAEQVRLLRELVESRVEHPAVLPEHSKPEPEPEHPFADVPHFCNLSGKDSHCGICGRENQKETE